MTLVTLAKAERTEEFGGKAVQLGMAVRAGLPVPPGLALSAAGVEAIGRAETVTLQMLEHACERLTWPVAVRSSGIGEDGATTSFAGQHESLLNVRGLEETVAAVRRVRESAHSPAAVAYRARLGLNGTPGIGAVIQYLVEPDRAGVLFTCNPVTGADERVIEAAWGFGEVVVSGRVTPDRYRLDRGGAVLEATAGYKDICLVAHPAGGLKEQLLPAEQARTPCLNPMQLSALHLLATRCEALYSGEQDIEWAFRGNELYLLQRRDITTKARG